jgi:hypothetical protein
MRGSRRHIAIFAAFLWLLGIEVLPNVHLGTHDRHHTHAVDGTIIVHAGDDADAELERLHQLAHRQAGTKCLHKPKPQREQLAYHAPIGGHTANGIAHRATALLDPTPPLTSPASTPEPDTWLHAEPHARISIAHATRPNARGPPIA